MCYFILIKMPFFFQVTLRGYNHKLRILLETIVEKIATFEVKTDRFSVIKVLHQTLLTWHLFSHCYLEIELIFYVVYHGARVNLCWILLFCTLSFSIKRWQLLSSFKLFKSIANFICLRCASDASCWCLLFSPEPYPSLYKQYKPISL